jgi:hypothetical protein
MKATVKERPILFSGPMVMAILDGRKTQTRRVIKPQPTIGNGEGYADDMIRAAADFPNPRYSVGDILWVRETFARSHPERGLDMGFYYRATVAKPIDRLLTGLWKPSIHMPREAARIFLRVKDVRAERLQNITTDDATGEGVPNGWPIDAVYCPECKGDGSIEAFHPARGSMEIDCPYCNTAIKRFANLWDSLNAKRGYGWAGNPWVWKVSVERLEDCK